MCIRTIIFDFDGVIADSVSVKTDAFYELYQPFGKKIANQVVAHHLAHGGVSRYEKFKYYHRVFLNQTLSDTELAEMADVFSKLVFTKVVTAPYVRGALSFIQDNADRYTYFISSGTPEIEIRSIVQHREIDHFFEGIYGSPAKKVAHIRRIMDHTGCRPSEIVFIGDATSDRDAAYTVGTHFIARVDHANSPLVREPRRIRDLSELESTLARIEAPPQPQSGAIL